LLKNCRVTIVVYFTAHHVYRPTKRVKRFVSDLSITVHWYNSTVYKGDSRL